MKKNIHPKTYEITITSQDGTWKLLSTNPNDLICNTSIKTHQAWVGISESIDKSSEKLQKYSFE